MSPVPPEWHGKFYPRDPLVSGPPAMPAPVQSTPDRVEGERNLMQEALAQLGRDLSRRAGT